MNKNIDALHINDFDHLIGYLQQDDGHKGWVFRGQSNAAWTLLPSFYRGFSNPNPAGLAIRHLEKFRIYVRGRVPNTDGWIDERYWALGRHYGLKTPLLDWTASPFIALFFAFSDNSSTNCDRALYALNASYLNRTVCKHIGESLGDSVREDFQNRYDFSGYSDEGRNIIIGRVLLEHYDMDRVQTDKTGRLIQDYISSPTAMSVRILSPKWGDNPRLLSQRGVFTYQKVTDPIEDIISSFPNEPSPVLIKIVISDALRTRLLTFLNNMNINLLSLFPDLEGASRYCNEKLTEELSENIRDLNINRIWL